MDDADGDEEPRTLTRTLIDKNRKHNLRFIYSHRYAFFAFLEPHRRI